MKCKYCEKDCIKKGLRKRRQYYQCTGCGKHQFKSYLRKRSVQHHAEMVVILQNEGVSISGIARILKISKASVINLIHKEASMKKIIPEFERNQEYEVDELRTFIGNKKAETWITYAINKRTKRVVSLTVGRRTKIQMSEVTEVLNKLNPKRVYTDGLSVYRSLLQSNVHRVRKYAINGIERLNLTLRTHLKRLNRKTICYSKSMDMLKASLLLYIEEYNTLHK
jgi:insertion element IS1 protein InsB